MTQGTPQRRCLWCNRAAEEPLEEIAACGGAMVHQSHRAPLEEYCRAAANAQWRFLGGIGVSIVIGLVAQLIMVAGSKFVGALIGGAAALICGVTVLKFPFATPETVALLGVHTSVRVARWCAVVILFAGVAVVACGIGL